MYGLFGKMTAVQGKRDELLDIMLKSANDLRDYEGCYLYVISVAPDDPDGIWIFESWRDEDAHRGSLQLESVQAVIAVARPLIAGFSDRVELTPLGGKGLESYQ
jgi:quinol monooxygenase YgiN